MQRTVTEPSQSDSTPNEPVSLDQRAEEIEQHEPRNLMTLAAQQIVTRVGWIFKTESIIMPAFVDHIVGVPWLRDLLRGCLPVLNRFGHSVPPVLFAGRLRSMRYKRRAMTALSFGMAVPFLVLSAVWFSGGATPNAWLPWLFLLLYGVFFVLTGMNHLAAHTLQGKLIRATRRGRLLALSTAIGCPAAILAAWLLLGRWQALPDQGYGYTFGFTGLMFALAAVCTLALKEPADHHRHVRSGAAEHFAAAWRVFRSDANFRRLALVAGCFSVVLMLFPHYQALGRERLGLADLMLWVCVQNAGTAIFSVVAGPMADRHGNRLVMGATILCCAITPLLATAIAQGEPDWGRRLYWIVFVPIGLTPVAIRTLTNYALEISEPADHPRYVSTLSLCIAAPIMVLSPLLGLVVSFTSFEFVFLVGAAVTIAGGLLTARLIEPRHHVHTQVNEVGVEVED